MQHFIYSLSTLQHESRLFDLLLLKKELLHYMLNDKLEELELPIADRQLLRGTLVNPEIYRLRMGHRTFSAGAVVEACEPPELGATWLDELSITGAGFFHFVEARQLSHVCLWKPT